MPDTLAVATGDPQVVHTPPPRAGLESMENGEGASPAVQGSEPAHLNELLGHVSSLTNNVRPRNATQALVRLRETRPELFNHSVPFVRVHQLLAQYKVKLVLRRFLHDLLDPAACSCAEATMPDAPSASSAEPPLPQRESFARLETAVSGQL